MTYPKRVLIAIDQLFAVVLFGTMPDETISAMAHRRGWKRLEQAGLIAAGRAAEVLA